MCFINSYAKYINMKYTQAKYIHANDYGFVGVSLRRTD